MTVGFIKRLPVTLGRRLSVFASLSSRKKAVMSTGRDFVTGIDNFQYFACESIYRYIYWFIIKIVFHTIVKCP
jgi:hypothetical protein